MILAMIGDYLLGFGTFSFSDSPDAYMGMTANVVPDWRYAVSSVLGFICAALFALAATELMKVMEKKHSLADSKLYREAKYQANKPLNRIFIRQKNFFKKHVDKCSF